MPDIDLHVHTSESDGSFTPGEAVRLAAERDLATIAVTDHDTTSGLEEARRVGEEVGVDVVPGIEFSAEYDGASLHVLAYWPDPDDPELRSELARLIETRFRRGELMISKLEELGHPISFERVREIAGPKVIARPHVAEAMVEAGIVPDEKAAFDRFISDGGPAWVPKHALHPLDALKLIRAAGGVCVIAHPGMWKGQGSVPDELIEEMAAGGMAGIEVDHPDHDAATRARFRDLGERLGLAITGSSDCHGTRYDPVRMGCETTAPGQFERLRDARPS
jgi:3',5'-nucleoside bisphosphate phosphatase